MTTPSATKKEEAQKKCLSAKVQTKKLKRHSNQWLTGDYDRSYPQKNCKSLVLFGKHTEIYITLDAVSHFGVLIYLATPPTSTSLPAVAQSWVSDDWATVSEAALSEAAVATSWMILGRVKRSNGQTALAQSQNVLYNWPLPVRRKHAARLVVIIFIVLEHLRTIYVQCLSVICRPLWQSLGQLLLPNLVNPKAARSLRVCNEETHNCETNHALTQPLTRPCST